MNFQNRSMLVSVIIPAYNVEHYIARCLDSVLNQSHKDIEIICVDDCSVDKTYSIMLSFKQNFPAITILRNTENKGASYSRNFGLSYANGEFIQFLDSDDVLLPEKISHQSRLLVQSTFDFVAGACKWHKLDGKIITTDNFTFNVFEDLFFSRLGDTCSNLWRKECILKAGGWNEDMRSSQETDLMFRLVKQDVNVLYDNEPFTLLYQRVAGSISLASVKDNLERYILLRFQILKFAKENNKIDNEILGRMFNSLFLSLRQLFSFDPDLASSLYEKYFPKYMFLRKEIKSPLSYKLANLIFGFKFSEFLLVKTKRLFL
jgi:glycosyltransferase involved in cell wall biosynthesis